MADTITVRAAKQTGKAILWDVDDRHPGGEIFISGNDKVHDVAETGPVLRALADGRLVKVTSESTATPQDSAQDAPNDADTTDEPSEPESDDTGDSGASDDGADGDTAALVSDESGVVGVSDSPAAKKRGGKRG